MNVKRNSGEMQGGAGGEGDGVMPSHERLDLLKWTLDGVQEQIRFADSKAAFVIVFQTFLFGFVISQAETLAGVAADGRTCFYWFRMLLFAGYVIASVTSIGYAIAAVIPRFGTCAPRCGIFFGHIVAGYGRRYDSYHDAIMARSEAEWIRDVTSQIVENSNIANDKHRRAGAAARWAATAAVLVFVAILALVINVLA